MRAERTAPTQIAVPPHLLRKQYILCLDCHIAIWFVMQDANSDFGQHLKAGSCVFGLASKSTTFRNIADRRLGSAEQGLLGLAWLPLYGL